jgi:hypothetical protein
LRSLNLGGVVSHPETILKGAERHESSRSDLGQRERSLDAHLGGRVVQLVDEPVDVSHGEPFSRG